MDKVGFIILRHVNSEKTDLLWKECYHCIRRIYPENEIVIIDSQSNFDYVSDIELYKTQIIHSEFPNRGECLPYYYYCKYKWFDTAVIFHDSVYVHHEVDFSTDSYKILWGFDYAKNERQEESIQIINSLDNHEELLTFYTSKQWVGCFGSMTCIKHAFLKKIDEKYNLENLLYVILTKRFREALERVFACMLQLEKEPEYAIAEDLFKYLPYGIPFEVRNDYSHLPVIKVWGSRT